SSSGTPNSRASLRTVGEACGSRPLAAVGSWAGSVAVVAVRCSTPELVEGPAGAAAGASFDGLRTVGDTGAARTGDEGAPPVASTMASGVPLATLSPTLTFTSFTTPAWDEGISIEALSLSTVIRLCSALTVSPGLLKTSMTATWSKSPMSGTTTVTDSVRTAPVEGPAGAAPPPVRAE